MTDLFEKTEPQPAMSPLRRAVPISGVLDFDEGGLVTGLRLAPSEVLAYFRDGRRAQPLIERRLIHAFGPNGWRTVATMGGGRRLQCVAEITAGLEAGRRFTQLWDVRVFVRELSFAPSCMKGTGRRFDEAAFDRYYHEVTGVFVCDVSAFPRCPYWRVGSGLVLEWAQEGLLGTRARVDREDVAGLLEGFTP